MKKALFLLTILYPGVVYIAASQGQLVGGALALGGILALRLLTWLQPHTNDASTSRSQVILTVCAVCLAGILAYGAYQLLPTSPLLYPVCVNLALFLSFGLSLIRPPTVIERIATATRGPLPPEAAHYCRRVCATWTLFFAINGALSLDSVFRSLAWWSLYNGLLSYIAIGILFGVEWLIRQRVMKRVAPVALIGVASLFASLTELRLAHCEPSIQLASIQEHLKPPSPFRASFVEKKYVAVLTAPLESKGEIQCVPSKGIVWRVTAPITKTSLITPSGVTTINANNEKDSLHDRTNISAALLSLMSGDIDTAAADFTITASGTVSNWKVTLTPRDTLVAEVLEKIVVSGTTRPESVEVHHTSHDRVVTVFSQPTPLTSQETTDAESALNEASS